MIAGKNEVVVARIAPDMSRGLSYCICRALKPARAVRCLLGCDDVDEAVRERVHTVRLRYMMVERCGIELRQHEDAPQIRMQAVADRHVDEPVFAADGYSRLGALRSEERRVGK